MIDLSDPKWAGATTAPCIREKPRSRRELRSGKWNGAIALASLSQKKPKKKTKKGY